MTDETKPASPASPAAATPPASPPANPEGGVPAPATPPAPGAAPAAAAPTSNPLEELVARAAGEFNEKGQVTVETLTLLKAAGVSEAMVKMVISGARARLGATETMRSATFGSTTNADEAIQWAKIHRPELYRQLQTAEQGDNLELEKATLASLRMQYGVASEAVVGGLRRFAGTAASPGPKVEPMTPEQIYAAAKPMLGMSGETLMTRFRDLANKIKASKS